MPGQPGNLSALRPVRLRDAAIPVAGLLAVAVVAGLGGLALTVTAHRTGTGWPAFRGWALMSVALLSAGPGVAVMYGIRHVAGGKPTSCTGGEQASVLMALQRLLQRLLAAVGSLVALSTLALGAALALEQSLPAGFAHSPTARPGARCTRHDRRSGSGWDHSRLRFAANVMASVRAAASAGSSAAASV